MICDGHLLLVSQGLSGNDGLPGYKGFKVGKIQILLIVLVSFLGGFFCTLILKFFVFQGIQGSPGLPGLIGQEGQKVSSGHYVKHYTHDRLFLHQQNLLRRCWILSVRFVWYGLFKQQGPDITVNNNYWPVQFCFDEFTLNCGFRLSHFSEVLR